MASKTKVKPLARTRNSEISQQDLEALGKEMVEWVTKKKPLHLSHWYTREKHIIYKDWKNLIQFKEFLPYYEKAISVVAENCLDGTIDKSIAQRFLRIYFKDIKDDENEKAKYEADLRIEKPASYSQEDIDRAKAILDQITRNQKTDKTKKGN